jgi:hypothetical protein
MIRFAGRISLIAALVAGTPLIASAQAPWRQVYKDADVTVLFDTASTSLQSPGTWTTITSWDYTRPRVTEFKKPYSRLVERAHVRCSPVRVKRVRSTVYASNNVLVRDEGEVDPRDQAHMVWDRPKPGTAGKNAFETICGIVTKKSAGKAASATSAESKATAKKSTTKTASKKATGN